MVPEIVGRDAELSSLHAFIDEAEATPAALVLEGEAGIGKSTLWEAGVAHAREQGLIVLSSRPAEAEQGLGHVGLDDLLGGALDDLVPNESGQPAQDISVIIAPVGGGFRTEHPAPNPYCGF